MSDIYQKTQAVSLLTPLEPPDKNYLLSLCRISEISPIIFDWNSIGIQVKNPPTAGKSLKSSATPAEDKPYFIAVFDCFLRAVHEYRDLVNGEKNGGNQAAVRIEYF